MKLRGAKRIGLSIAASVAMVGGLALTAPATASAAPIGEFEKPGMKVEQGDFGGGKNLQVTITNPNEAGLIVDGTMCTATLLDGALALRALVAFNDGDVAELLDVLTTPGVRVTLPAINIIGDDAESVTSWKVDDGVYVLVGTCGGGTTVLNPTGVGIAISPVIVPSGFGSIAPGLAFGSLLLESGDALTSVLPLLLGAGGALS